MPSRLIKERDAAADEDPSFHLISGSFRSDATTSSIWHGSKLQALELESRYVADVEGFLSGRPTKTSAAHVAATMSQIHFADLQRVSGNSGLHATRLIRKQLHSLGCRLWNRNAGRADAAKSKFNRPEDIADIAAALEVLCKVYPEQAALHATYLDRFTNMYFQTPRGMSMAPACVCMCVCVCVYVCVTCVPLRNPHSHRTRDLDLPSHASV